jgi:hypothetical protein
MRTVVVNLRDHAYDVYIGRGSIFGNPYRITDIQDREEVIKRYRKWFLSKVDSDPKFREAVLELRGKILGCYCIPLRCHGEILVEWLEQQEETDNNA